MRRDSCVPPSAGLEPLGVRGAEGGRLLELHVVAGLLEEPVGAVGELLALAIPIRRDIVLGYR